MIAEVPAFLTVTSPWKPPAQEFATLYAAAHPPVPPPPPVVLNVTVLDG